MEIVGSIASIVGLLIGILSAYWAYQAHESADDAKKAADAAQQRFFRLEGIEYVMAILEGVRRIKEAHHSPNWEVLRMLYTDLRQKLVRLKTIIELDEKTKEELQVLITHTKTMENAADNHCLGSGQRPNLSRNNQILRNGEENLQRLLDNQKMIQGGNNGKRQDG